MIWIIPIGGKGTRTQALGEFKPFIEILGHKMLSWFLVSIKNNISPSDSFVFVGNEYFEKKYNVSNEIRKIFKILGIKNQIKFNNSVQISPGISAALFACKKIWEKTVPVVVICPDQYIDFKLPSEILSQTCYMTVALDFGKEKGYMDIKDGFILRFVEKEHISNYSSTGVFIASSGEDLSKAIDEQLKSKMISCNGEYCIGTAFNFLIKRGHKIYPLLPKSKYSLGEIPSIEYFSHTPLAESLSKTMPKEV